MNLKYYRLYIFIEFFVVVSVHTQVPGAKEVPSGSFICWFTKTRSKSQKSFPLFPSPKSQAPPDTAALYHVEFLGSWRRIFEKVLLPC